MNSMQITIIYDYDLDNLMREHFPDRTGFETQSEFELNGDCDYLCQGIHDHVSAEFSEWYNDDCIFTPGKHHFLNALCSKGVITAGNYLLRV